MPSHIDLYRTLAYKSNMETILVFFALLGGQNDQGIDPASIVMKKLAKGVYDEVQVQTVAVIEENNASNFIDKIRILE